MPSVASAGLVSHRMLGWNPRSFQEAMVVHALEVCTFSQQLWLGEIPAHLPMVLSRVGNVGENGYLTGRYKNGTWQVDSCCMYANDTGEC